MSILLPVHLFAVDTYLLGNDFWHDSVSQFCGKVLNSVDVGGENSALIAAGASDATLRIWDPRRPGLHRWPHCTHSPLL